MLDKNEVREIAFTFANSVCQKYNPKQIVLFGSYADGIPNEESDIDIAVIYDVVDGNWLEHWGCLIGLRENISYDIEVHLLDETCNRTGFLNYIRSTGEIIFQAEQSTAV